jgi:hypothetical protein
VESTYDTLVAQYVAKHSTTPSRTVQLKLAQQAALTNRPGKAPLKTLQQQITDWVARALDMRPDLHIPTVIRSVVYQGGHCVRAAAEVDVHAVAARVVDVVSTNRATWTVYHVRAEVERQLRGVSVDSEIQHEQLVHAVTTRALGHDSIRLDIDVEPIPALLTRDNGESVFRRRGSARYTSQAILDAEQCLVDATTITYGAVVPDVLLDAALAKLQRKTKVELNAGQRDLVRQFVTSGRALGVAIGPPGTGKSTAMRAVRAAWETTGGRVIGLAPSAAAAGVLGDELGVPADTIHRLVVAHAKGFDIDVRPGDMLLIDEAGMAGTRLLDAVRVIAAERGAVIRLLGDHRQLASIESGGTLRLLFTDAGGTELTEIHRFDDPTEAAAVLKVRVGDTTVTDWYAKRGRLHGGVKSAVLDQLYTDWQTDQETLRTAKKRDRRVSIMAADGTEVVAELSARAQHDLRAAGGVEATGVPLRDGNHAGRGDLVVTRLNDRRLRPRITDHVKNGDLWRVVKRHDDGRLRVKNLKHGGKIILPARYVRDHVELGYATTINRAQGITTGIIRAFLSLRATREALLVALSRGSFANHAYLDTHEILALDEPDMLPGDVFYRHRNDAELREAFAKILRNEGAELSATETLRDAFELPFRLQQQVSEYDYGRVLYLGEEAAVQAEQWLHDALPHLAGDISAEESWPALHAVLREVADLGHDPVEVLVAVAAQRELDTADSIAKVLHHRVSRYLADLDVDVDPLLDHEYRALLDAEAALGWHEPGTGLSIDNAMRGETISDPDSPDVPVMRSLSDLEHDPGDPTDAEIVPDPQTSPDPNSAQPHAATGDLGAASGTALGTTPEPDGVHSGELLPPDPTHPVSVEAPDIVDADIISEITWADLTRQEAARLKGRREGWRPDKLPGWVAVPPPADDPADDVAFAELRDWLRAKAESISERVQALAWRSAAQLPAWTEHLGEIPTDPLERDEWMRRAGQVAAYRECYEIPDTDPSLLGTAAVRGSQARARTWVYNFLNPVPPTEGDPVLVEAGHAPHTPQLDLTLRTAVDPRRLFSAIHRSATEWLNTQAEDWVREALPPDLVETVLGEAAWPALVERLHAVEDTGGDPVAALTDTYGAREVNSANAVAQVLHYRLSAAASAPPETPSATSTLLSASAAAMRDRLAERGRTARVAEQDDERQDVITTPDPTSPETTTDRSATMAQTQTSHRDHPVPTPGPDFFQNLAAASTAYLDAETANQASTLAAHATRTIFRRDALRDRAARIRRQIKLGGKQQDKQEDPDLRRGSEPSQGPKMRS